MNGLPGALCCLWLLRMLTISDWRAAKDQILVLDVDADACVLVWLSEVEAVPSLSADNARIDFLLNC